MAYRAHIKVYGENGKALGASALDGQMAGLLGTRRVHRGSRQGIQGLWLEKQTKSAFEAAVSEVARMFVETGYTAHFGFTNVPSEYAGIPMVRFWKSRGGRLSYGRV